MKDGEERGETEAVRKQQRGKGKDGKCGRKQEKVTNERVIICTEMEPFSPEIRREHKCLFSPLHTSSGTSGFLPVSLFKLYVGVGVTGQISVY